MSMQPLLGPLLKLILSNLLLHRQLTLRQQTCRLLPPPSPSPTTTTTSITMCHQFMECRHRPVKSSRVLWVLRSLCRCPCINRPCLYLFKSLRSLITYLRSPIPMRPSISLLRCNNRKHIRHTTSTLLLLVAPLIPL